MPRFSVALVLCVLLSCLLPMGSGEDSRMHAQTKKKSAKTAVSPVKSKKAATSGKASPARRKTAPARGTSGSVRSKTATRGKAVTPKKRGKSPKSTGRTQATPRGSRREPRTETRESAPSSTQISVKQEELDRLRREIQEYESKLAQSRTQEKSTLERLDVYHRQTALIRTLVGQLNGRILQNSRDIAITKQKLMSAEQALALLQRTFARYVISAYKRGPSHDSEILLSSQSLNHMYTRAAYLRAYTQRQRAEAEAIRRTRQSVAEQKAALEQQLALQQRTMQEKQAEELRLQKKQSEQKELLDKVRLDKERYQQELRAKQAAARKIEAYIAELIRRERARRAERSAKETKTNPRADRELRDLPMRPISETAFGRLKGRLPWPVSQGRVVGDFGEQVHPTLKTVTISNGIDIGVSAGATVHAVADGEVSVSSFIPGYGNLLILSHDDGFFTVYAHLTGIAVREGQRVRAGHALARAKEGESGGLVHFEIWREKNKHNPLGWLSGR